MSLNERQTETRIRVATASPRDDDTGMLRLDGRPPDCSIVIAELGTVHGQLRIAQESLEHVAADARDIALRASRAERARLAQILHDGLQQLLVAAKMRLHASLRTFPQGSDQASAMQAMDLLCEAINASRTLTSDLSPLHYVDEGLGAALLWLSDWFTTHHGLKVDVDLATDAEPQSEALRTVVFQGVREILFNTVKHAGTDAAQVRVEQRERDVQVVIEDRGIGFEPSYFESKTDGFGLFSVKRRLESLGGSMDVVSAPGAGTRVTLRAPLSHRG
jgi:signal transduction histidine kinase